MLDKHPGDRLSIATTQVLGSEHISSDLDRESYLKLARGYNHHDTNRVRMCKINEEVAIRAGQHEVAQTWALLGSLLTDFSPSKRVDPTPAPQSVAIAIPSSTTAAPSSAYEPPSATKSVSKSPPISAQSRTDDPSSAFSLDGFSASAMKRRGSGGAAMLAIQLAQNQRRRGSSPSLLSATRPGGAATRSPSSSPASHPMKLPPSSMSMSYNPGSIVRSSYPRRISVSSAGNSHSHSPGPKQDAKKPRGLYSVVADGALSGSSEDEASGEAEDAVIQSETSASTSWSKGKKKVTRLVFQHPTLHSSSSSARSSPAQGANRPLPPSHLVGTKAGLISHTISRISSPQSQLLNIQDVNEDPDEEEGTTDEDGDGVSLSSASIRMKRPTSDEDDHTHDAIDVPYDSLALTQQSPPSPTLAKYMARSNDSSKTTTIGRGGVGLKILTKQDSTGSLATAYQTGPVGYVGSFGSNIMTPTMGRMGIGSLAKQIDGENNLGYLNSSMGPNTSTSRDQPMADIAVGGSGRRDKPGGSLSAHPKSLSDLFTPQSNPPSATTVATPSTNAPSSTIRPTAPPNPSSGFRDKKNRGAMASINGTYPPGSAGPEHDSFALTQDATEQAMEEKSTWVTEYADVVRTLEEQERDKMWAIMKECLDGYADEGNVQMCAALAMAAHKELDLSPERLERIVLCYLGS